MTVHVRRCPELYAGIVIFTTQRGLEQKNFLITHKTKPLSKFAGDMALCAVQRSKTVASSGADQSDG